MRIHKVFAERCCPVDTLAFLGHTAAPVAVRWEGSTGGTIVVVVLFLPVSCADAPHQWHMHIYKFNIYSDVAAASLSRVAPPQRDSTLVFYIMPRHF